MWAEVTSPRQADLLPEMMSEEELLNLNCTGPDEMNGQTRMRQHTLLHTQIQAFEKLLQHANSKFSREKLYQMLKMVETGLPYFKGNKIVNDGSSAGGKINNLAELKEAVKRLTLQKRKGIHKEEEISVVEYFHTFFRDIQFLKNLKSYFDERIYSCLYKYYYDPLDGAMVDDEPISDRDTDSGHSSQSDDDRPNIKPTPRTRFNLASKMESESESDKEETNPERDRLVTAVKELYELNIQWDKLFNESQTDIEMFDEDSSYEIHMYKDVQQFALVFRLVPDMFIKGIKSNRWAKLWWMQANKLCNTQPDKVNNNNQTDELEAKIAQLKGLIVKFGGDIIRSEQQIIVFENDLIKLKKREIRSVSLTTETRKVKKNKDDCNRKYNEIVKKRSELKVKLSDTIQGTVKYNILAMQLRDVEHDMVDHFEQLKLLEYHGDLLQGDQRNQQESRPQVIKFCESIQTKISQLRRNILDKKVEKRRCEKTLALLKTNCEKMTNITSRGRTAHPVSPIIEVDEVVPMTPVDSTTFTSPEGPSFFITQADDDDVTDSEKRNSQDDSERNSQGDRATADAVQERLKLLYKDFDFDDRYRPSSVATLEPPDGDDPEVLSEEELVTTPMGFRAVSKRTLGKLVNHTYPLKVDEYHLKP